MLLEKNIYSSQELIDKISESIQLPYDNWTIGISDGTTLNDEGCLSTIVFNPNNNQAVLDAYNHFRALGLSVKHPTPQTTKYIYLYQKSWIKKFDISFFGTEKRLFHSQKDDIVFENKPQEGELTVIHITTTPSKKYTHGWWVHILDGIYIQPVGTQEKLGLVYAHNVPISPERYYFNNEAERIHFTLFFPALPTHTTHINIVEQEGGNEADFFNFYNVPVSDINSKVLKRR